MSAALNSMGLPEEQAASRAFILALVEQLQARASSQKELETVIEQILPVLVSAVEESEERREDGDKDEPAIQPLDHIARYLFRRNPRHSEPVSGGAVEASKAFAFSPFGL
ncbi:hypothetical protein BBJ28_00008619 [Nothophytophthora sp. Chile5]|nr:hypothetical protein BBJ28_00008619 [Nothophytophthora sp. Chile5]